jgi:LysR family transcriptional regulator for metE and metH
VLVVSTAHRLAGAAYVKPEQLRDEVLITYPVPPTRLDVFTLFLTPAGVTPRAHKVLESTELMLQMVAGNRGVAALPRWLVEEHRHEVAIAPVRLGRYGVPKQIHLGMRVADAATAYLAAFVALARKKRI